METEALSEEETVTSDSDRLELTCHVAIFSIIDTQLSLLLTERNQGPFRFQWELPGSIPQPDEDLKAAAARNYAALSPDVSTSELQQLGTYGFPGRDPRHRAVAVVYWGIAANIELAAVQDLEPSNNRLVSVSEFTSEDFRFAFDHGDIASDALRSLRHSLAQTSIATALCQPAFTMSELQRVYEVVFDRTISAGNFHRKVRNTPGFVQAAGTSTQKQQRKGRPAQRFEATEPVDVSPPFDFGATSTI